MRGLPASSLLEAASGLGAGVGGGDATVGGWAGAGAVGVAQRAGVRAGASALGAVMIDWLAVSTMAGVDACTGRTAKRAQPPASPTAMAARLPKANRMFDRSIAMTSVEGCSPVGKCHPFYSRVPQPPLFRAEQ